MNPEQHLSALYKQIYGSGPRAIAKLPGAGSGRCYFRLFSSAEAEVNGAPATVIGTYGGDAAENRAFVGLSADFSQKGLPVPEILGCDLDNGVYLQQDLGDKSLYDLLKEEKSSGGFSPKAVNALSYAVDMLVGFQYAGGHGLDFAMCYPEPSMNRDMIEGDLNYFKYCFLKPSGAEFDELELRADFNELSGRLWAAAKDATTFMVRDFQSRNIMVAEDGAQYLIDYQGGRRGPVEYDVASFLWQARAGLSDGLREVLIERYIASACKASADFNAQLFRRNLPYFVLFRLLQVLGAYGFRGWQEGKAQFIITIPAALDSLLGLLDRELPGRFPAIRKAVEAVKSAPKVQLLKAELALPAFEGLTVKVFSFSYKKGVPADVSGNGGGFLFDCRAVHNPGRFDEYKPLTGRDEPVRRFLEENGEILEFLSHCKALVFASVDRYLSRGFTSLSVGFGCTGGRHRSVYSAESMAHAIKERNPEVGVVLEHVEQKIFEVLI